MTSNETERLFNVFDIYISIFYKLNNIMESLDAYYRA